ncbi:MAG: hypothetical protein ACRDRU_15840 [Pseudonocardiaceae bacterium]
MARRRGTLDALAPGVELFERSTEQWCRLGAPLWVYDIAAAAEAYATWASRAYGGGVDPTDQIVRRYYVMMAWWPWCVRPQWLHAHGHLTAAEEQILATDKYARWGRPGRCRSPQLNPDADCPDWLACCRVDRSHYGSS